MTQAGFLTSLDLECRFYHRESSRITGEIAHLSSMLSTLLPSFSSGPCSTCWSPRWLFWMSMNWMLKMSFDVSPQKRAHDSSIHHFHLMTSSGHNGWMITITPNELFRFTMTADELLFRTWDINRKESNQSFFVDLRGTPVKDQLSCSLCQTIQSSSQLDQALHST